MAQQTCTVGARPLGQSHAQHTGGQPHDQTPDQHDGMQNHLPLADCGRCGRQGLVQNSKQPGVSVMPQSSRQLRTTKAAPRRIMFGRLGVAFAEPANSAGAALACTDGRFLHEVPEGCVCAIAVHAPLPLQPQRRVVGNRGSTIRHVAKLILLLYCNLCEAPLPASNTRGEEGRILGKRTTAARSTLPYQWRHHSPPCSLHRHVGQTSLFVRGARLTTRHRTVLITKHVHVVCT